MEYMVLHEGGDDEGRGQERARCFPRTEGCVSTGGPSLISDRAVSFSGKFGSICSGLFWTSRGIEAEFTNTAISCPVFPSATEHPPAE